MLDLKLVRERPDIIRDMLAKRGVSFPLDDLLAKDAKRRQMLTEVQKLKHLRNLLSLEIAQAKREGRDVSEKMLAVKELSERIDRLDAEADALDREVSNLLKALPNLVHESVPIGRDESDNVVLRSWGEPKPFQIPPRDHIALGLSLDVIDLDRAAKVAGSRFYYLKDNLVRLNYALISYALDFLKQKGFTLLQPPYMLKREAIEGTIIISDFEDVIYKIEGEDLYLIGTAEHAIAAMHMDEILDGLLLPLRYGGISPCFRKEAGAHGRDTKGIFRVHQFEKVEQFVFCKPEDSWREHEMLIRNAEEFFQSLEIPYRVVLLCSGDLGKTSAKTYDLEAWFPAQNTYREVVSCSNCLDYQARRLRIKYRDKPNEESRFVHTLNSTLVATERALIAIMENHQNEDSSINIPKVLRPYFGDERLVLQNRVGLKSM
ncbi:MAG: serine--tRNA ligase [Thaumarchaeota archaeon]|nr:serine--tRNA ligase [Nitrososphaerota archaeon]